MTGQNHYVPFMISRLLAGMFAAMPTVFGSSYITDIFYLHERGKAFVSYELSFLGGVVAGPTIGGFIVHTKPWPWVFWWTLAPVGAAMLLVVLCLKEIGFQRDKNGKPWPSKEVDFVRDIIKTFLPGNRVVPRTSPRELVSFCVLLIEEPAESLLLGSNSYRTIHHWHHPNSNHPWTLCLHRVRIFDHAQHIFDHFSSNPRS